MALGGFFPQIEERRKQDDEFRLIAARVAEQMGSARATSQSAQTQAATAVAERPQPTRAVTLTENPDGTITRTETVKNAPKKDPQEEIAAAANEPYAVMTQGILEDAAELAAEQKARFDRLQNDPRWNDPAGRRALAGEAGIVDPADEPGGFMRRGLFRYRGDRDAYERIVNDPDRLREAVLARQFQSRRETAESVRPFASDAAAAETRDRLDRAETRRTAAEDRAERKAAIIDLTRLDTSSFESPEKVVEWMKRGYAPEEWEKVKDYLEPAARMKYADDARTRETESVRRQIAENDAKIRQARENRQDERSDAAMEHLILSNDRLRQIIDRAERGPVVKTFPGWTSDDLIEAVGRADVDQDALIKKANSRLTKIADEWNANVGKVRVLAAEIKGLKKTAAYKTTDIAVRQTKLETLEEEQKRLLDEKNRLLGAGFGGRRTNAAKVDPLGIR